MTIPFFNITASCGANVVMPPAINQVPLVIDCDITPAPTTATFQCKPPVMQTPQTILADCIAIAPLTGPNGGAGGIPGGQPVSGTGTTGDPVNGSPGGPVYCPGYRLTQGGLDDNGNPLPGVYSYIGLILIFNPLSDVQPGQLILVTPNGDGTYKVVSAACMVQT